MLPALTDVSMYRAAEREEGAQGRAEIGSPSHAKQLGKFGIKINYS